MDETYIPHMNSGNGQAGQAVNDPVNVDAWANARQGHAPVTPELRTPGAPVVGFLYTLSNNNQAEFWPCRSAPTALARPPTATFVLPRRP